MIKRQFSYTQYIKLILVLLTMTFGMAFTVGSGGGGGSSPPPPAVTLKSVTVDPAAITGSIPSGVRAQMKANGTYSNNSVQDLTASATWSSTDDAVVLVSNDEANRGVATTVGSGTASIYATSGGIESNRVSVTVADPTVSLSRIMIEPVASGPTYVNKTKNFKAIALFSNDASLEVTEFVTWSSSMPGVATISNDHQAGTIGTATGVTVGTTQISAKNDNATVTSNEVALEVSAGTLVSVVVEPAFKDPDDIEPDQPLPVLGSVQYKAIAVFSDDNTIDGTALAAWTSDKTSVAIVSSIIGSKGIVSAIGVGTANITATDHSTGKSGSRMVQVVEASLTKLEIFPNPAEEMPAKYGFTQQLNVTGTFSNNITADVTFFVSFFSTNNQVATVGSAYENKGLVTALTPGTTTIRATWSSGETEIVAERIITVNNKSVDTLEISPTSPDPVPDGKYIKFSANAIFTNGKEVDFTERCTWQVSDDGINPNDSTIIAVGNYGRSKGLVLGRFPGTAYVRATDAVTPRSTAWQQVTVSDATLESTFLYPSDPGNLQVGDNVTFRFWGFYSNHSRIEFTKRANWTSSNPDVAYVFNSETAKGGVIAGPKTGTAVITVTEPESKATDSIELTVTKP